MKWRRYPSDVLPAWVAEMDVPLAEPIVTAVTDALSRGDTGRWPHGRWRDRTIEAESEDHRPQLGAG